MKPTCLKFKYAPHYSELFKISAQGQKAVTPTREMSTNSGTSKEMQNLYIQPSKNSSTGRRRR